MAGRGRRREPEGFEPNQAVEAMRALHRRSRVFVRGDRVNVHIKAALHQAGLVVDVEESAYGPIVIVITGGQVLRVVAERVHHAKG